MLNKILIDKYSEFLESIDVEINGNRPWDLTVHNPDVFKSILFNGSLGFGESYMKGWFDCERLDLFFEKVLKHIKQVVDARNKNKESNKKSRTSSSINKTTSKRIYL